MRKKILLLTIASFLFGATLFLGGCASEDAVTALALKEYNADTPLEVAVGEFCYEDYTVVVTHGDGTLEEVPLTEEMISDADQLYFYQEGHREITITYKGASTVVAINVSRKSLPVSVRFDDFTAVYTGETFTVEVQGELPNGAKVSYPQGNTFKNAGEYDIAAVIQCEGYKGVTLFARVSIQKATYDVSNAQLYDATYDYDKTTHTMRLHGLPLTYDEHDVPTSFASAELPSGVTVSYSITKTHEGDGSEILDKQTIDGNQAMNAGVYEVRAKYKGDALNYEPIPDCVKTLTIQRQKYDMSKINFGDKSHVYTGEPYSMEITNQDSLPVGVSVAYQIKRVKDQEGAPVEDDYKEGNTRADAGTYLVKAIFEVTGKYAMNYQVSPNEEYAYLTINRADYDEMMSKVHLDYKAYTYEDGAEYKVTLDGDLPEGVEPTFSVFDDEGNLMSGTMGMEKVSRGWEDVSYGINFVYFFEADRAGDYDCVVTFSNANKNYMPIPAMETQIIIESIVHTVFVTPINNESAIVRDGVFNYDGFQVFVLEEGAAETYSITLSEDKLYSESERDKFVTAGEQTIRFIYEGFVFEVEVVVEA